MAFKHELAQLEVICKAGAAESVVQLVWGKITKIELLETPTERTYTYATNLVANGAETAAKSLLQGDYDKDFVDIDITTNASNAVTAAGMFAPAISGTAALKLKVYTTTETEGKEVVVQLKGEADALVGFEKGLCHKVTLEFKASGKNIEVLATTIDTWKSGYAGSEILEK